MASIAQTRRRGQEETLTGDTAALQRQINTLAKRLSEAQQENKRLRSALQEAYRLVDTFYADMTDEASEDLEAHLISALDGGDGDG